MASGDIELGDRDYAALSAFRFELRRFLHFSQEAAREAGLQPRQHQALLAIRGSPHGKLTVGELADRLMIRPHSASELASRLADAGLVERDADPDARRRMLRLSPAATGLLDSLSRAHRQEIQRLKPLLTDLLERLG